MPLRVSVLYVSFNKPPLCLLESVSSMLPSPSVTSSPPLLPCPPRAVPVPPHPGLPVSERPGVPAVVQEVRHREPLWRQLRRAQLRWVENDSLYICYLTDNANTRVDVYLRSIFHICWNSLCIPTVINKYQKDIQYWSTYGCLPTLLSVNTARALRVFHKASQTYCWT